MCIMAYLLNTPRHTFVDRAREVVSAYIKEERCVLTQHTLCDVYVTLE